MNSPASQAKSILICKCQRAHVFPAEAAEALEKQLSDAGIKFAVAPDLCEWAGNRDERLKSWTIPGASVVACFPRAVKWLFQAGGASLPEGVAILNLRTQTPDEIAATLKDSRRDSVPATEGAGALPQSASAANWPAWFPVIDYDRCTQCMQCLSFCLFGVYGVDADHQVQVQNPDQCKTSCPACSRVCPETAIMFPKHKSGPIHGGPVPDDAGGASRPKVDISALLGGDAHAMIRARSAQAKSRFSKDRNAELAMSERRKYLAEQGLIADDIPAEVLMNLPSPEVIARKAREAAARAQAALDARKKI